MTVVLVVTLVVNATLSALNFLTGRFAWGAFNGVVALFLAWAIWVTT